MQRTTPASMTRALPPPTVVGNPPDRRMGVQQTNKRLQVLRELAR